jgi:hypothetical protein
VYRFTKYQLAQQIILCLAVSSYYWIQTEDFYFFKDDLANLYAAYQGGWLSLFQPVFERGPAPLFRLEFLAVAREGGPSFTLARIIIVACLGAISCLVFLLGRTLGHRNLSLSLFVLTLSLYPLYFGTVKWISSAFHLLPAMVMAFALLVILLDESLSLRRQIAWLVGLSVVAYGFGPPEAVLIGSSCLLAIVVRELTKSTDRYAPWLFWLLSALLTLMFIGVIAAGLAGWDSIDNAVFGSGKGEVPLLFAVFAKTILRYSLPAMLAGNVFYLDANWVIDMLAGFYLALVLLLGVRGGRAARFLAVVFVSYILFNFVLIVVFRAGWFGWIIIPEHRYWLFPELLLAALSLVLLHTHCSIRWPTGGEPIFNVLVFTVLAVLAYQSGKYVQGLFPGHDFSAAEKLVEQVGRRVEAGGVNTEFCDSRLPDGIETGVKRLDYHRTIVRYFSVEACSDKIKLPN